MKRRWRPIFFGLLILGALTGSTLWLSNHLEQKSTSAQESSDINVEKMLSVIP